MTAAREKRECLEAMAVNDVRDAEEKARLLAEADEALGVVRQAGDLLTAAALSTAGESESAYESRRGICLLYTSPSPRDKRQSRMPSSA